MDESTDTVRREVRADEVNPGDHLADVFDARGYVVVTAVAVGVAPARPGQVMIATDGQAPTGSYRSDALVTVLAAEASSAQTGGAS